MSALRPFNDNNMENPGVALICVSKAVWSVYAPFFFLSNAFFSFSCLVQAQNRFKVPLGTKFYRVKAVPWNRKV